jgi:spore germination protein KA
MRYLGSSRKIKAKEAAASPAELIAQPLSASITENLDTLKKLLQGCSDAVLKEFRFGPAPTTGYLIYFDGLADRKEIEDNLLRTLLLELNMIPKDGTALLEGPEMFASLQNRILTLAELKSLESIEEVCHHIASGDCVILIDGWSKGLVAGTRSWEGRKVASPENEIVIFGPKEGFTETIRFNTALLRRRLKSTSFKIESMVLGRISKTDVVVCYIENIAPPGLVEEVKKRLSKIDIDAVLDTGYISEIIADNRWTIFNQMEYTEKPDRVCGSLLEGRLAIMVDGSPMVLVLPISFPQYIVSPEDYYLHFIPASLYRLLRLVAFMMALTLPSLYVAIITYHHEMIPTPLLLTIAATRQGVPFPAFVEALILDLTFELLREAGLRLPRAVGPAVSIVGALIIGDAAVRAGLVSTPMVVIIAFTGIASFVTPSYNAGTVIRIARFGFLFAAGALGFLGITIALILMGLRMVSLTSFGMPYMAPIAPFNLQQMGDIIIRRPWFKNRERPFIEGMKNQVRQSVPSEDGGVKKQ